MVVNILLCLLFLHGALGGSNLNVPQHDFVIATPSNTLLDLEIESEGLLNSTNVFVFENLMLEFIEVTMGYNIASVEVVSQRMTSVDCIRCRNSLQVCLYVEALHVVSNFGTSVAAAIGVQSTTIESTWLSLGLAHVLSAKQRWFPADTSSPVTQSFAFPSTLSYPRRLFHFTKLILIPTSTILQRIRQIQG